MSRFIPFTPDQQYLLPPSMHDWLVYGHATGVFSSRKIERATYESVVFRYIAAELTASRS